MEHTLSDASIAAFTLRHISGLLSLVQCIATAVTDDASVTDTAFNSNLLLHARTTGGQRYFAVMGTATWKILPIELWTSSLSIDLFTLNSKIRFFASASEGSV